MSQHYVNLTKSLADVMNEKVGGQPVDFDAVLARFTPSATVVLDGEEMMLDAFIVLQKARAGRIPTKSLEYLAISEAGPTVLSHHVVTHVGPDGKDIAIDAFAQLDFEGDKVKRMIIAPRVIGGDFAKLRAEVGKAAA